MQVLNTIGINYYAKCKNFFLNAPNCHVAKWTRAVIDFGTGYLPRVTSTSDMWGVILLAIGHWRSLTMCISDAFEIGSYFGVTYDTGQRLLAKFIRNSHLDNLLRVYALSIISIFFLRESYYAANDFSDNMTVTLSGIP